MEAETPLSAKVENSILRVLVHFYPAEHDDYEAKPCLKHIFWDLETIRVWVLENQAKAVEGRVAP